MTRDLELEAWQRDWRLRTEPVPELKKKIARQNIRTWVAIVVIGVCLAISTVLAVRTRKAFTEGLATGIWLSSVSMGAYAWWVRRGAWKPTAQTTLAYAELCRRRAIAKQRLLRFAFYFLLVAIVLYAGFVSWYHHALTGKEAPILAALVGELLVFRYQERRMHREIAESARLVEQLREPAETNSTER